ncbi:toxin-antitoxin system YwqK family antitoxin [Glaciimonas sp. PCH181]|uniref:toxin-antitoxin system YwqK family antitoxin n=1 Tax=Glaciimonas sp. PCH181 TaxID=2133943 RepID=UPI00137519CB|nr:hypothetical protein [Glaciimonas sp. PCH181]
MNISTVLRQTLWVGMVGATLLLAGCGKKVLDFRNAEIVQGKIYSQGADSPFSGRLTNISSYKIPNLIEGTQPIGQILGALVKLNFNYLGSICDVTVENGILNGKGICHPYQSDQPINEFSFDNGALQDRFKVFSVTTGKLIVEANYDNGHLDGKMLLSNPDTGKLIYKNKWKEGKPDGDVIRYTLDGEYPVFEVRYVDGKKDGTEKTYHPTTHKLIAESDWDHGIKNGSEKRWSDDGSVLLADLNWLIDRKESGFEKEMDATGTKLLTDLTWESGKATGLKTVIHTASGIVSDYDEYHLKDDLFDGVYKKYIHGYLNDKDIMFASEVDNYKNGKLDGHFQKFSANGTVWNEGGYKEDLKDGLYRWFDSNGKIQEERTYKDGAEIMTPIPVGLDVNNENCVKSWIVARRIESGSEISLANISGSEFIEFKTWCEQGKTPTPH